MKRTGQAPPLVSVAQNTRTEPWELNLSPCYMLFPSSFCIKHSWRTLFTEGRSAQKLQTKGKKPRLWFNPRDLPLKSYKHNCKRSVLYVPLLLGDAINKTHVGNQGRQTRGLLIHWSSEQCDFHIKTATAFVFCVSNQSDGKLPFYEFGYGVSAAGMLVYHLD